jgi:glycosyltransferase involved in cell wall biosynthesis
MSAARPDVLVDLTPLDTTSRFRGIGRYARGLGLALAALSDRERGGLAIGALTALSGEGALGPLTYEGGGRPPDEAGKVRYLIDRRLALPVTLRSLGPRVFHALDPVGTPRGSGAARVLTCHDLLNLVMSDEYYPGRPVWPWALRAIEALRFHGAARVIAISSHTASDLMRMMRVPASRIDVVPQGVEHERFHPPAGEAEAAAYAGVLERLDLARRPYFTYVGGADPRKAVDTLVRAFARARLDDVDLALVGRLSPGEQEPVLRAIREAGSPANIRLLGFVSDEDVPAVLHGALGLAFPSVYEGFGLPVLEAMAAGCPVICTRASSLPEVAGDAAVYVPPRDERALAEALSRLAGPGADGLRDQLRRAGLAQAARFSWRSTALGTVETYLRVLG